MQVARLRYLLPDARVLLDDVTFRVGEGAKTALIGANGAGKTTLLRLIAGDIDPDEGSITTSGGVAVMRQFIGSLRDATTVRSLLLGLAPAPLRATGQRLLAAEAALALHEHDASTAGDYAQAVADWSGVGGYDLETLWNTATTTTLGEPFDTVAARPVAHLSGGEQKRLCLEVVLRGHEEVLLLDEPDNFLDVPGKRWLEAQLRATTKTVLFVTHDREMLANTAERCVTVEARVAWVHGGGFAGYREARQARIERLDELHRRWDEERQHLALLVRTLQEQAARSPAMASRYSAAQTRLRKYEEAGPPQARPRPQNVRFRLTGGRTGDKVLSCARLEIPGLVEAFDLEVRFGERIAAVGRNGSGKSHFLRLLSGEPIDHGGVWNTGARVVAGLFAQKHDRPDLFGQTIIDLLLDGRVDRGRAMGALRRYELDERADQRFDTLSGGEQARFQILLLELSGATLLLLDEPTDNLDVASAEALEAGLSTYTGTVIAATHDRWFARSFDRFLVFDGDGGVRVSADAGWAAE